MTRRNAGFAKKCRYGQLNHRKKQCGTTRLTATPSVLEGTCPSQKRYRKSPSRHAWPVIDCANTCSKGLLLPV